MGLREHGRSEEKVRASTMAKIKDHAYETVHWRLEKRSRDLLEYQEKHAGEGSIEELRTRFMDEVKPFEVIEFEGNLMMNVGINVMLDLLMGAAGTVFSNANAYLGVGDSAAAAAAAQTDLQAGVNKTYVGMNGGFPVVGTTAITFQSDFTAALGNYAWEECATFNGNNPPVAAMLNRKVQPLGTKAVGATWTLSMAITIS